MNNSRARSASITRSGLKISGVCADGSTMSDEMTALISGEVREAKKAITGTGMRTGRMGAVAVVGAAAAFAASRQVSGGLRSVAVLVALVFFTVGVLAVAAGWQLSKAGGAMISALSDPTQLKSAFVGERQSLGGRRVVSVMLLDGRTQSVALPEERTNAIYQLLGRLAPKAQLGVHATPQRAVLQNPDSL